MIAKSILDGIVENINVNYKEMYLKMVRASENAINLLIVAQQICEDIYIGTKTPKAQEKNRFFFKKTVDKSVFCK